LLVLRNLFCFIDAESSVSLEYSKATYKIGCGMRDRLAAGLMLFLSDMAAQNAFFFKRFYRMSVLNVTKAGDFVEVVPTGCGYATHVAHER